jgi:hypothetical protein
MTPTLSINDQVIDDCFRLVEFAEKAAMQDELKPYHNANCGCWFCVAERWAKSPEAAEFVRRMR